MPQRTAFAFAAPIAAALIALALTACDDPSDAAAPDGTYTVRGQISEMSDDTLAIHHEAIPGFRNREGEVTGMASMAMLFHRPASVAIEGIEPGDPVEITFDVRWLGDHTLTITAIRELPEGTELELTEAHH